MALAVRRERRLIKPPLDLYDLAILAVNAIGGRDGEQVHLARSLAGSLFVTARRCEMATTLHVHE